MTGSSWHFHIFLYLNVKVLDSTNQFFANMAEFVDFEAINEDLESTDNDDTDDNADNDGNVSDIFIDGKGIFNESVEDYQVTTNAQDVVNDMLLFDCESQEANVYCREDFDIMNERIDEFQDSQKMMV